MHVTFHVLLENHQAECRLRPVGVKCQSATGDCRLWRGM